MDKEEKLKLLEDMLKDLESLEKKTRSFIFHTGSEGAKNFAVQLLITLKETAIGKELSEEDKQECRDIIESEEWPAGPYEISDQGIKFLG